MDIYSEENSVTIGGKIGRVIEIKKMEGEDGIPRGFLRIKARKRLVVRFWWTILSGEEKWADIKYE